MVLVLGGLSVLTAFGSEGIGWIGWNEMTIYEWDC